MDPELCCLCSRRPSTDVVDERYPVCAVCVDLLAVDELPPHPWSGAWEFPSDSLFSADALNDNAAEDVRSPRRTA